MSDRSVELDQDTRDVLSKIDEPESPLEEAIEYTATSLEDSEEYFDPFHAIRLLDEEESEPLDEIVDYDIRDEEGMLDRLDKEGNYQAGEFNERDDEEAEELEQEMENIERALNNVKSNLINYAETHNLDSHIIDTDPSDRELPETLEEIAEATGWIERATIMEMSYKGALDCFNPLSPLEDAPFGNEEYELVDIYEELGFQVFDDDENDDERYLPPKPIEVGEELLGAFIEDYKERRPHLFSQEANEKTETAY